VRRPVVRGAGEQLRQEDREHDLPRSLGVRASARLDAQGEQEQRAGVVRHRHIFSGGEDGRTPD
jgi:hypothetical protein